MALVTEPNIPHGVLEVLATDTDIEVRVSAAGRLSLVPAGLDMEVDDGW